MSIFPQLAIMALLMFIFSSVFKQEFQGIMFGAFVYLVFSIVLERGIPYNHRKGISLTKKGNYAEAIEEFHTSYSFFRKHSWVDKYRYATLLSSSKYSYAEMALTNLAFCYLHSNNLELAKQYYQKTLALYPDNDMAKNGLSETISIEETMIVDVE
jgi:tetratricopeptide (TPR) repeat protein